MEHSSSNQLRENEQRVLISKENVSKEMLDWMIAIQNRNLQNLEDCINQFKTSKASILDSINAEKVTLSKTTLT